MKSFIAHIITIIVAAVLGMALAAKWIKPPVEPPELGAQMLELQLRHNRLWWAGINHNWNLAYFMISEIGETLAEIEASNPDAIELQPERLADVMPTLMNPAIKGLQDALAKQDEVEFKVAFDQLSASCTACHELAGFDFLRIKRPETPLLDNLDYTPNSNAPVRAVVADSSDLYLAIENHRFAPEELRAPANKKFKIVVENKDPTPEEFESIDLKREKIILPRGKITITLGPLKPGAYSFFGDFHQDTAQGRLIVE